MLHVYSFGMLLWELAFERIPYEKWEMSKIREYVSAGGRENIQFGETDLETKQLQQEYAKVIVGGNINGSTSKKKVYLYLFEINFFLTYYHYYYHYHL